LFLSTSLVVRCSYPLRGESASPTSDTATRAEILWHFEGRENTYPNDRVRTASGSGCASFVDEAQAKRVSGLNIRGDSVWAFVAEISIFAQLASPSCR